MKRIIAIILLLSLAGTSQTVTTVPTTVWVLYPATMPAAMLQDYDTPFSTCTFNVDAAKQFETDRAAYRYKVYMETKGTTEYWGTKPVRK